MSSSADKRNIVVLGGSYVGTKAANFIAQNMHETHRTILIEKNSHFQHLFAFSRYAVVPGYEHQAFIPFTVMYSHLPAGAVAIVQARATTIHPDKVVLADGDSIPYDYLVLATGSRFPPPSTLHTGGKLDGIAYLQQHQRQVAKAEKIVVVGGGAVGVQTATDIKDYHPSKSVTLVHSRDRLMHKFHPRFNDIILERAIELGIEVVLEDRVVVPTDGFPLDGSEFDVTLRSGRILRSDFVILATGQTPLSDPLRSLSPSVIAPSGFISVKRTLQIADDAYPNVFAIGDVADTTHQKAARTGEAHARLVANNIATLVHGSGEPLAFYDTIPRGLGIHMSLGLKRGIMFMQSPEPEGQPIKVSLDDNGALDAGSPNMWKAKAPGITDYYL